MQRCLNTPMTGLPAARPARAMRCARLVPRASAAAAPLPAPPGPAVRLAALASGLLQSAVKSVKLAAAEYKRQTMEQVGRRGLQEGICVFGPPAGRPAEAPPPAGLSAVALLCGCRTSTSRSGRR